MEKATPFPQTNQRSGNLAAPKDHALDDVLRRGLDFFAAFFGLLLLSPLFLFIAVLIKQNSPGPVFYRGKRAGRNGAPFQILKFRTMVEDAASYNGPKITSAGDARITPVGRFLRDTKLNELPQLWNVLVGEMALVGPRPEDFDLVETWPAEYKSEILSVRPGITSPASIVYRWEEELLQQDNAMDQYLKFILPEKLRIDQIYIRRRSLLVDLDIILLTLAVLFPIVNKAAIDRGTLFYWGPISRIIAKYFNWFLVDMFVSFFAVALAGFLWRLEYPLDLGIGNFFLIAFLAALLFSVTNALIGLQNISWRHASYTEIIPLTTSVAFAFVTLIFIDYLLSPDQPFLPGLAFELPFNVYIRLLTFAWFGFVVVRYNYRIITGLAYRLARRAGAPALMRGNVLLVGAGQNAHFAVWLLNNHFSRHYSITGLIDDEPTKLGMRYYGVPVLGASDQIPELVQKRKIDLIVFTIKEITPASRERILALCNQTGRPVVMIPDILDSVERSFAVANQEMTL